MRSFETNREVIFAEKIIHSLTHMYSEVVGKNLRVNVIVIKMRKRGLHDFNEQFLRKKASKAPLIFRRIRTK